MKLFVDVSQLVQQYYVTRDSDCLVKAIEAINEELHNPSLQEHTISLRHMSTKDVTEALSSGSGFIKIDNQEADSSGVIVPNQAVRVYPNDLQDDTTCFVFNVAHIDDMCTVLVAVGGMPDAA